MDRWTDGPMGGLWTTRQTDGHMVEITDRWPGEERDGRTDRMDRPTDRCMDASMDGGSH